MNENVITHYLFLWQTSSPSSWGWFCTSNIVMIKFLLFRIDSMYRFREKSASNLDCMLHFHAVTHKRHKTGLLNVWDTKMVINFRGCRNTSQTKYKKKKYPGFFNGSLISCTKISSLCYRYYKHLQTLGFR